MALTLSRQEPEEQRIEAKARQDAAALRAELERESTEELFAKTLVGDFEDDSAWKAVHVLQERGTLDVFESAKRFCATEDPNARARGLSILAQLCAGKPDSERPFMDESVSIATDHLRDSAPETVRCAAWALSHLGTQQAVLSLIELRNHMDPEVRQAVVCCIPLRKHPDAVNVLVTLMDDSNEEVRDWATFALGSGSLEEDSVLHYVDSTEIREAFRKRLDDSYEDARREAIWGLALRHDPQGLKLLLNHLESDDWWYGDMDAAEELLGLQPETTIEELRSGLRRLLT